MVAACPLEVLKKFHDSLHTWHYSVSDKASFSLLKAPISISIYDYEQASQYQVNSPCFNTRL